MISDTIGVIGFKRETRNFFSALSSYDESKLFSCNITFFCRSAALNPIPLSFRPLPLPVDPADRLASDESPGSILAPEYASACSVVLSRSVLLLLKLDALAFSPPLLWFEKCDAELFMDVLLLLQEGTCWRA